MAPQATNPEGPDGQTKRVHAPLGWILALLNVGYAIYAYYGLGPPPGGLPTDWWHPHSFMLDWSGVGGWVDRPVFGASMIALPGALLTIGTFLTTRSAIARALALSATITALLFGFCGFTFGMTMAWEAFNWRFSWVMVLTGLAIGCTIVSPLLVQRWLALPNLVKIAIYLPLFFYLIAAVRGATGTSEHMAFLVSPWPIFTTFGLEAAVVLICGVLGAMALGVLALSEGLSHKLLVPLGILAALAVPGIVLRGVHSEAQPAAIAIFTTLTLIPIGLGLLTRSAQRSAALQRRGIHLALAALMIATPIVSGRALANGDYTVNRYVRAPQVIDALQRHIEKEEFFPEKLSDLVEAGYLDGEPAPRIGFGLLQTLGLADVAAYRFNEYGSSYVLEFDSSEWVQCSYSGQYYFDDGEEEEWDEEDMPEEPSWSCLGKGPGFLADDGAEQEEDEYGDDYDEVDYDDYNEEDEEDA
jgi:hypothetical protein